MDEKNKECKEYHVLALEKGLTILNSVYTRSGQNSTPNSNATNLHSSQKRCCSFCISSSNASPTFQVQKSIFHQMTKPIQVTVILPLLLAISFSRNDDIHSSISGMQRIFFDEVRPHKRLCLSIQFRGFFKHVALQIWEPLKNPENL